MQDTENSWESLSRAPKRVRQAELERSQRQLEADRIKQDSEDALTGMLPLALKKIYELMHSDDEQVVLRACETVLSRRIPKVAATQTEAEVTVHESFDRKEIKETIMRELNKGKE